MRVKHRLTIFKNEYSVILVNYSLDCFVAVLYQFPSFLARMLSFSACNCTANQTLANTTCDPVSGQCKCDVSEAGGRYGGRQCDTCARRTVGKCVTKNDTVN